MKIALVSLACIYWFGFVTVFVLHAIAVPNITIGLILLRSTVWPIFWATGWPHGEPMPMD